MVLLHRWIKPCKMESLLCSFVAKCGLFLTLQRDRILMYEKNLGNYYFSLPLWLTSLHQMALYSTELALNCNFIDLAANAFCICTSFNICFGTIVL